MGDAQDPGTTPRRPYSRPERAEAVYRATLAIATELSVGTVLQKIVDSSRDLVQARYGALGVIDEGGSRLTRFIVSGVEPEQIRRMGHWPRGLGLLGELIQVHRPLRVKNIGSDPRSVGFPPHHPPMTSFLGVPILRGDRVLGNLYMTDKLDAEEFSEDDEEILSLFAAHAAIALENARLYTETDLKLKEKVIEVERAERRSRFMAELGELLLKVAPGENPPLEMVAERATEALGDAAALYLVDQQRPETVATAAVFHTVQARSEAAREVVEGSWGAIEEQVIHKGRSLLATEGGAPDGLPGFDLRALASARFSAALAVPIATRRANYGLFVSLASQPLTLTDEDLRFALLIADRLGSALDGARLFQDERQARQKVGEMANLAERRASELETILDTMSEAVYVLDRQLNIVRINRAYADLVGLPDKDAVSWTLQQHMESLNPRGENGEPLPATDLPMTRGLAGESFVNQVLLTTSVKDGQDRYLSVSGAPLRDTSGEIVASVNVARDITESKLLDHLKDEFISVASHELKTPLTVVIGYAQLLQRKLEAAKIPEAAMAQKVVEQADRLTVLAERLLDVSRIQFGRLALERRPVDLAVLVTQVGDQMQIGNLGHPIRVSVEGPVHSSVDRERLHQVLGNLISNAAKYSPEGTDVEVMLRRHDGEAIISIRDRGRGIPAEQQSMLFQRFYRARTAEGKPGLGLGLYLSKGIVEAHGGRIWFESQEGEGTTFHVHLPAES